MKTKFYTKLAILLTLLFIMTITLCSAQEYNNELTFSEVVETPTTNNYVEDIITVEDVSFVVFVNSENSLYYTERISKKTGKPYKQYLGYETSYVYNNAEGIHVVFSDEKGENFWYLGLTKNEYLKKVPLEYK